MKKKSVFLNLAVKISVITLLLNFSLFSVPAFSADKITEILFVSEELPFCARQDGTGLYWDILRAVFEPSGIKLNTSTRSYSEAVKLVRTKDVDAVVASYFDEIEGAVYPKSHFGVDVVMALFKKGKMAWKGKESLKGKKVGWIKGYAYGEYLGFPVEKIEFRNRKSAISALKTENLDFFIDPAPDLEIALEEAKTDMTKMGFEKALELKLYLAFAKNDRGKELAKIFDEIFPQLVKSGEIRKLYEKWFDRTKIESPF